MLTRVESIAVQRACQYFLKSLEGEARAVFAVVVSQMRRGITLDHEETELVRAAILASARADPGRDIEKAYFRLYGAWCIDPPWYERESNPPTGV